MATYKGILLFPSLFTAKQVKDAAGQPTGDPKFSAALLIRPDDPNVPVLTNLVNAAVAETFPNGFPARGDKCFGTYDEKFGGKEYYDPRFKGWYVLTTTAKADDKPAVVDMNRQPVIDANSACSGAVVYMNANVSGYVKGTGGIGGWLNGVMVTEEPMPFGRLDGKPSVEQMFADVGGDPATGGAAPSTPNPAPTTPPPAPAPTTPPAPPPAPAYIATEKAGGATVDQMLAWEGWTEQLLVQHGYIIKPSFA